jgi:serine/threonine protein kinase
MRQAGSCLSDGRLAAFTAGLCDDASRRELEEHIGRCEGCADLAAAILSPGSGSDHPVGRRPLILSAESIVGGRYVVERFLGLGGIGEVHLARDRILGVPVALKTLNASLAGAQRSFDLLKAEVGLARRVTHPNVCRIFDCGVDERGDGSQPLYFLTMEFLPGTTLRRALEGEGAFTQERATRLWRQVVEGLAAAHRVGVVHRDLKPENIMLLGQGESERAVILDFGLATAPSEESARSGRYFVGTLRYAAPEQIAGQRATPACDVYAAGLVMWEMLTGAAGAPRSGPAAAAGMRRLLDRATSRTPEGRFGDAVALLSALERLPAVSRRVPGRRKWRWLAAASLVGCLAAYLGVAAMARDHQRPVEVRPQSSLSLDGRRKVSGEVRATMSLVSQPERQPPSHSTRRVHARPGDSPVTHAATNEQPGGRHEVGGDDLARDVSFGGGSAPLREPAADTILPDPFMADPFGRPSVARTERSP